MANIFAQSGDDLSEQELGEWINFKNERNNFNDDPSVTVDFPNNQVTAGGDGEAYIQSGDKLYRVEPDEQTLALPDSNGQNWLYLTFTPGTDDQVSWEVSNTQGGPSDPKLLRAVIDTSATPGEVDDRNLAPETEHNKIDVNDSGTDPSANGEIRRNGSDTKVYTGGSVLNFSNVDEGDALDIVTIDDTDSPYTTSDEDIIYVDESGGAVTVTLATADATNGNAIEIYNLTGSNTVTVDTEGSETIDPDGDSSKAIDAAGWGVVFVSNGTNWAASLAGEFDSATIDSLTASTATITDIAGSIANSNTISDLVGSGLEVASNTLQVLSSIWDGTNLVADVNNSSTTSDTVTINNADGSTIDGDTIGGFPSSSSDAGLTLGGGFTVLDANRPVLLVVRLQAQTDGSNSDGIVSVEVDESGGSTADYSGAYAFSDQSVQSAPVTDTTELLYLPPGASVSVVNQSDPTNNNSLVTNRKFTL